MPRRARILLWSVVGLLVFCPFMHLFGWQTLFAVEARYFAWKEPFLWSVPVALADQSISESPGVRMSYNGYGFEVPWDDLDQNNTKRIHDWQIISFRSGKEIVLTGQEPDGAWNRAPILVKFTRAQSTGEPFGTDYAVQRHVLETSPARVTPFSSRRDAVDALLSLLMKQTHYNLGGGNSVFLIQTPTYRGFQYGDPKSGDHAIEIRLYSKDGSFGLEFLSHKDAAHISQAEINRVLQTIRPVGDRDSQTKSTDAQ